LTSRNILLAERAFGLLGISIACWMVYRLGPSRIMANIRSIGWGFLAVTAFKSAQYLLETLAWMLIASQKNVRMPFWLTFKTVLEGEALNYLTLTRMGGEPLKAVAFRESLGLARSAAAVIVLKFCNLLGFWLLVCGGFALALYSSDLPADAKTKISIGIAFFTVMIVSASWMQRIGLFGPLSWILEKFEAPSEWIREHLRRLTRLDDHVLETYRSKPWRISAAALLCTLSWVEEIFFIWLALRFLHLNTDWKSAAVAGSLALLFNHMLFFVPWRAGTQEGTLVLAFTLLKLSEPAGLSIAILKRFREMIWVFAGLILFAMETLRTPYSWNVQTPAK